ncbi:hypothetical protein GJ700_12735 [Duganella sp. FT92W]|uniref:Bacteriophage tail tape measure N-terminal domain-containing protein n=1 Tax=Pseudoduganella rivuli TaxID=2666085 RepID=A0A7X2IMI2_9BURK|nr:hypothetical protein [Pseudoduganella rivuli]MRV72574.1 hypothetical protein [Pseudoduganella rivuli]
MIIGDMEIRLRADIARLQADMTAARSAVTNAMADIERIVGIAKKAFIGFIGVASVGAFVGMVKGSIEATAGLHDLSIQTGASVAGLMALRSAAATTDTTIQDITGAMNKMAKGMASADEDGKGIGAAIAALGINFKQFKALSPDEQMVEVAKAMDKFQDGAGKSAIAMTFYGKEGAKMLPFLKDLADMSDTVTAKMTEQQKASKAAQAAMADDFSDNLTKLKKAGEGWKKDVAMGLLPALYEVSQAFVDLFGKPGGLKAEISKLAEDGTITAWARGTVTAVTYVSDAFEGVWRIVKSVGQLVWTVLQTVGQAIGAVAAQITQTVQTAGAVKDDVLAGRFGAASDKVQELFTRNKEIAEDFRNAASQSFSELGDKMLETFSAQSLGSRIRDRIEEIQKAGGAAKEAKKVLEFDANQDAASAAAKRKEEEAYISLITAIRAKTAENRLELAVGENATESQKATIKLDQELASGKLVLIKEHQDAARAALAELAATEQLLKAKQSEKEVQKWITQSMQARSAELAGLEVEYEMYGKSADAREIAMVAIKAEAELLKDIAAIEEKNGKMSQSAVEQMRREKDMRVEMTQAALAEAKALNYAAQLSTENKRFAAESILDEKDRAAALLAIDAEMWQERIRIAGEGTEAQRRLQEQYTIWYANQVAKPQIEEQRKLWESIERTAHDTFVSILDGGKGLAQRLRDTLKNVFFDWLYSMTLKPWIVNLQGQFSAGGAASLAGGESAAGGALDLLSAVKTGYTAISNGLSGMAGMFTEGLNQFGATITSNVAALGEWMGGGLGNMLSSNALAIGNAGVWAGGIGAGLGAGKLISNGYSVAGSSGNGAVMLGTALGALWGPLGSALGGAIGGLVNRAFGMGAKEVTGTTLTGNLGTAGFDGKYMDAWTQKGGWFRSDKSGTTPRDVDAAMATGLSDTYAKITAASRDYAKALGVDADYITGRSQSLSIALTKDQAANEKAITDFFAGVANTIAGELVPSINQFTKEGEAVSATLQRLAVQYTAVDAVLKAMGASSEAAFGAVGVASLAARERLLTLSGGLDAFASQTSFFAQNFLTEAQRMAPVQDQVTAKMAELGLVSVDTIDEFSAAVMGLTTSGKLATEAGAATYEELMKIAPAFKQVADYTAAANKAQAEAAAEAAQRLAEVNKPYMDRITELEKALGYAVTVREQEAVAIDASTKALIDRQSVLEQEVAAREVQAKQIADFMSMNYGQNVVEVEKSRQAAVEASATQRANLEIQLYNLTHTAAEQLAAARERELAAADPLEQALLRQINAQQDMASAAAIAAKAIEDAAARARAVAQERAGIEREMLQLQGNTAGLRQLELDALDPLNRAAKQAVFDLQDKMAAEAEAARVAQAMAEARARAAEEAQRAEQALMQVRQSATDSIFDEVKRLKGLMDGGGAMTLAGAQSAFAIATAQARSGDQAALNALPGLSKTLADLAGQNARSLQELHWIQATTAASLQETAMGAVGQYGLTIPKFDQGTNLITQGGLAFVHPGEAVVPAASNGPYRASGGDSVLAAEMRALREEVAALRREKGGDTSDMARDIKRVADTLERVTDGADAMRVKNGDDVLQVVGA